jgi:thioredoxin 1
MSRVSEITSINKYNFSDEVLNNPRPVLVEFIASWCGACHIMAPAIKELAEEFSHAIKFCQIDIDENEEVKNEYGIDNLPAIIIFKEGTARDYILGTNPTNEMRCKIEELINHKFEK